jgi:hypothetical protein
MEGKGREKEKWRGGEGKGGLKIEQRWQRRG